MNEVTLEGEIVEIGPDRIRVRGIDIEELIEGWSYPEVFWFLLTGRRLSSRERRMLEAILVAMCDHGPTPPSTQAARLVASTGSPMHAALAAGLLGFGDHHAGAIELAMRVLQEAVRSAEFGRDELRATAERLVEDFLDRGERVPGFGHRYHRRDPRPPALVRLAERLSMVGPHLRLALEMEEVLLSRKGIRMNIDGASGAILSDMGLSWRVGRGVFALGRMSGLIAEVMVEISCYKPFRKFHEIKAS